MPRATVGTSAALLNAENDDNSWAGSYMTRNRGTVPIFIDNAPDVTTATGFQIDPGETVFYRLSNADRIYAISGTAGQRVDYVRVEG